MSAQLIPFLGRFLGAFALTTLYRVATRKMRPHQLQQPLRRSIKIRRIGINTFTDFTGDALAELYAPLIERVDVPDHALYEYLVLIKRNKRAEVSGVSSSSSKVLDGRLPGQL